MSDILSGVLCASYDTISGKGMSVTKVVEQVAYRVVGRKAAEMSTLTLPTGVIAENHWYTAGLAGVDGKLRKSHTLKVAGMDTLRAGASSVVADYAMSAFGVTDKVLF